MLPLRRVPIVLRLWTRRRARAHSSSSLGLGLSLALHTLIALSLMFIGRGNTRPPVVLTVLIAELVQEEIPAVHPAAGEDGQKPAESLRPEVPVKGRPTAAPTETARPSLGALLALVERAHRPEPVRSQPEHTAGEGASDIGGGENDNARGSLGNTPLKDFIRAQITRRWQVDARLLGDRDIVISLRLVLDADGSVEKVEILGDAAHQFDALYRQVAMTARNATLLSSPLQLPAGILGQRMDITVDLSTKDAAR